MMRRKPESRSPAEAACGMRVRNGRTDVEEKAGAGDSQREETLIDLTGSHQRTRETWQFLVVYCWMEGVNK